MRNELVALGAVLLLLTAGCMTGGTPTGAQPTPTLSTETSTATDTVTASPTPILVTYVVRAGAIPDEFASVTVTLQVVFVEDTVDLGPCYPGVYTGPYKPTITPIATPTGECHRSEPTKVDLTALEEAETLGTFHAPGSVRGHALILTDVTATSRNGTKITEIVGIGGLKLLESPNRPDDTYGVQLTIVERPEENWANYSITSEQYQVAP